MPHHAQSEALLTIAELSRSLQLPESTTRYYCRRFEAHLPAQGDGRRRRYLPEALPVLQTIAESMRQNKNAFAVDLALREKYPQAKTAHGGKARGARRATLLAPECAPECVPGYAGEQSPAVPGVSAGQIMSLMERQTEALQQIAGAMAVFAEKIATSAAQAEAPAQTAPLALPAPEETQALRDEVAALRQQVRTAEAVHQKDLDQLRTWLSRLGEALARR